MIKADRYDQQKSRTDPDKRGSWVFSARLVSFPAVPVIVFGYIPSANRAWLPEDRPRIPDPVL